MSRKIKPCVTVPYWKILQDKEKDKLEEEADRSAGQRGTLLDIIAGQAEAKTAERKASKDAAAAAATQDSHALAAQEALISQGLPGAGKPGPRWEKHETEGWWWHPATALIYSEVDRKYYVWEEITRRHVETDPFFAPPDEPGPGAPPAFRAEASSVGSLDGQCSGPASSAAAARSVVVRDLVSAGQAMKLPLRHLGRPSALFAVFLGGAGPTGAEFYAKCFHTKLLQRLSLYRGRWDDARAEAALRAAFDDLDRDIEASREARGGEASAAGLSQRCRCAAALLLHARLTVAMRGEGQATLLQRSTGDQGDLECAQLARSFEHLADPATLDVSSWAPRPGQCLVLSACAGAGARRLVRRAGAGADSGTAGAAGGGGGDAAGGGGTGGALGLVFGHAAVRPLLSQRRPRALAGAVAARLSALAADAAPSSASSSRGGGAAIALSVDFQGGPRSGAAEPPDEDGRTTKRPRAGTAGDAAAGLATRAPSRVRCRHILLKHRELKQPVDAVRRKRVLRPREDAEAILRALLSELLEDVSRFPQLARQHSECSSCLKGGEQAGDLGWLARGAPAIAAGAAAGGAAGARTGAGFGREVEEVAFGLEVGELSDLVASDQGMHLLQRVA